MNRLGGGVKIIQKGRKNTYKRNKVGRGGRGLSRKKSAAKWDCTKSVVGETRQGKKDG